MRIQQQFAEICIEIVRDKDVISHLGYTETEDSSFFIFNMNL